MLKVLKGFRHDGVDYRPGDDCPAGLTARTKELLIRARHLHDPKVKVEPRQKNELTVVENTREDWIIAPNAIGNYTRADAKLGGRSPHGPATGVVVADRTPNDPFAGQHLAALQDWKDN